MDEYVYLNANLRNRKVPDTKGNNHKPEELVGDKELLNISNIPQYLVGDYWKSPGRALEGKDDF